MRERGFWWCVKRLGVWGAMYHYSPVRVRERRLGSYFAYRAGYDPNRPRPRRSA